MFTVDGRQYLPARGISGVTRNGAVLSYSGPITPEVVSAMQLLVIRVEDVAAHKAQLRNALRAALMNPPGSSGEHVEGEASAAFVSICHLCPDGAQFQQIVGEARARERRWRLFIPRDYVALLSELEESEYLRVVSFDPYEPGIRSVLLDAELVALEFPVVWDSPSPSNED